MKKEDILEKLAINHTSPIAFLDVHSHDKVYGLYTFKNDVYCFKEGMDVPFDELTKEEQKEVLELFSKGNYEIDESLQ